MRGGEFAAALQGVPIEEPEIVLHIRLTDLDALHRVARTARCTLGILESSLEPEEITVGSELAVVAMVGTIRVLLVEELPTAKVISIEPQFAADRAPIPGAGDTAGGVAGVRDTRINCGGAGRATAAAGVGLGSAT